jgi:hypothetical protein
VWSLIDGQSTAADLADDLTAVAGLDRDDAEKTVAGFLNWLGGHGLLAPTQPLHQPSAAPSDVPADPAAADPVST